MLPEEQAPSLKGTGASSGGQRGSYQAPLTSVLDKGHRPIVGHPVAELAEFPELPGRLASQSSTYSGHFSTSETLVCQGAERHSC